MLHILSTNKSVPVHGSYIKPHNSKTWFNLQLIYIPRVRLAIMLALATYSRFVRPLGVATDLPEVAALTATHDEHTTAKSAVKESSRA